MREQSVLAIKESTARIKLSSVSNIIRNEVEQCLEASKKLSL